MKHLYALFCSAMLILLLPGQSLAHRVNIFAFVDGNAVQIECSFSKSQRVRNGKLTMIDAQTDEVLAQSVTDEQGFYRYEPDPHFLKLSHGLKIHLNAGEGHQNSWIIGPEELVQISGGRDSVHFSPSSPAQKTHVSAPAARQAVTQSELEGHLESMLDAKLAPMRQMLKKILSAQQNDSPDMRDIIGGIGWIIGLFGIAAYAKSKKC